MSFPVHGGIPSRLRPAVGRPASRWSLGVPSGGPTARRRQGRNRGVGWSGDLLRPVGNQVNRKGAKPLEGRRRDVHVHLGGTNLSELLPIVTGVALHADGGLEKSTGTGASRKGNAFFPVVTNRATHPERLPSSVIGDATDVKCFPFVVDVLPRRGAHIAFRLGRLIRF